MTLSPRAPSALLRSASVIPVALLLVGAATIAAQALVTQPAAAPSPAASAPASTAPAAAPPPVLRAIVRLDGPWRFAIGDDPRWADPGYDDSAWPTIDVSQAASTQGIDSYSGFAWYRMQAGCRATRRRSRRLRWPAAGAAGHAQIPSASSPFTSTALKPAAPAGMGEQPLDVPVAADHGAASARPHRPIVLAIRAWAGPSVTIRRGLVDRVELGPASDIADRLQTGPRRAMG